MHSNSRELNIEEVRSILESGNFSEFNEAKENEFLEAKPLGWLDSSWTPLSKLKLGKSVVSFANSKGGYLILGLNCYSKENRTSDFDVIKDASLFKKSEFPTEEIHGRIVEVTYPKLKDVDVKWYPSIKDPSVGILGIFVPPQDENKKFFFVNVKEVEGETIRGEFWAVTQRIGSETVYISVDKLYNYMKKGPNNLRELASVMLEGFERLEKMIKKTGREHTETPESPLVIYPPSILDTRISDTLDEW